MSEQVRIFRVDAFTDFACSGNPACVVPDAERLDERLLLPIAREQGGVDTAFVLPPEADDADLRVRFFTPRGETGLVGHATIAVHAVREFLGLPPARIQRQRSGTVAIERLAGPGGAHFAFTQPLPSVQGPLTAEQQHDILAALGIGHLELDPAGAPVAAGAGGNRALIAVRSAATLARLRPDLARLAALSAAGAPAGFFVYTLSPALADCDSEARMFCPAIGIAEDPVSGNAHAMLAAHLLATGRMPQRSGIAELIGRQGHHMGRPGTLSVRVLGAAGADAVRVRVAGSARIVCKATLDPSHVIA